MLARPLLVLVGAAALGGCQLISGLSGLEEGGGGTGHGGGSSTSASSSSSGSGGGQGGSAPCTADTANDPANCGACGHSCLGGPCSQGTCLGSSIVEVESGHVISLASDGGRVFFTWEDAAGHRKLEAVGVDGTGRATFFDAVASEEIREVAVASAHVYWHDVGSNSIVRRPKDGAASIEPVFTGAGLVNRIWSTPGYLAWVYDANTIGIGRLTEGDQVTVETLIGSASVIALDATHVYWAEGPTLKRTALTDLQVQDTIGNTGVLPAVLSISPGAAGSTELTWVASDTASAFLQHTPKTNGGTDPPASKPLNQHVRSVVAHGPWVFWSGGPDKGCENGTIVRASVDEPSAQTQVAAIGACPELYEDATAIYWATGRQIWRAVK